ncbi:hypothetical protein PF005_g445 [Phytophthora fragariae]|uniref:RxLR effector protein n=2 Tax=Phytophthora TaxID=4783 RepID=A0A6A3ZJS2_9STRA|nr:hypothetical protein PF009_g486 [Phytophthora fragariae]KAE9044908.1 hypothetical protein PR002_g2539 [Phytophthora rubi]KAE9031202.1 hypothetical protein PF011_g266 [Phytophthora fragariae]KAE9049462.1 hypothetical protein PR001_g3289 [Phytophthora rubi]KAE9101439.1 hypothetical protein PF010_g14446 [Phytophthora fragariae]
MPASSSALFWPTIALVVLPPNSGQPSPCDVTHFHSLSTASDSSSESTPFPNLVQLVGWIPRRYCAAVWV